MPRKKKVHTQKSATQAATITNYPSSWKEITEKLRWEESYTSLILGIIVVFLAGFLVLSYFRARNAFWPHNPTQQVNQRAEKTTPTQSATVSATIVGEKITGNTYTVKVGDQLWEIALRAYGDEFRWPDIAQANNLGSPDDITEGMTLKIPR